MLFQKTKKAVFVGAHTDDEIVAAGTLRKLVKAGWEVNVLTFSCAAIPNTVREDAIKILRSEFLSSMKIIGVENFKVLDFNPGVLPEDQTKIRQALFDFIARVKPDLAFILSHEDDHQDHSFLGKACEAVMKNRVHNILRCHFPWNFVSGQRNFFVSLEDDEFNAKLDVIRAYRSQHFRYDFESILASQARLDGYVTKSGPMESFEVVRLTAGGDQWV